MKFPLILLLIVIIGCQSDTDKKTIADQKKTIDSLQLELNDYKWYCEQWISKWK
jgi:hypothetical protein